MKNFVLILISFFSIINPCLASFEDSWCKAVEDCHARNFEAAEINFNEAISKIETSKDDSKPHVYVDRARLYMILNRYEEALLDLNKALESTKLAQQDRIRGLVSKIGACANLDLESKKELEELKEIYPNYPKIEITEKHAIIKNVPDCDFFKETVKSYFTDSGFCESENDISMLNSGICIIKKKSNESSAKDNEEKKD